jgi:hypothetical protein
MKNVKHTSIIKRHWNSYAKRGFSLQKKIKIECYTNGASNKKIWEKND